MQTHSTSQDRGWKGVCVCVFALKLYSFCINGMSDLISPPQQRSWGSCFLSGTMNHSDRAAITCLHLHIHTHKFYCSAVNHHCHTSKPNINPVLTLTLKPSLNPKTTASFKISSEKSSQQWHQNQICLHNHRQTWFTHTHTFLNTLGLWDTLPVKLTVGLCVLFVCCCCFSQSRSVGQRHSQWTCCSVFTITLCDRVSLPSVLHLLLVCLLVCAFTPQNSRERHRLGSTEWAEGVTVKRRADASEPHVFLREKSLLWFGDSVKYAVSNSICSTYLKLLSSRRMINNVMSSIKKTKCIKICCLQFSTAASCTTNCWSEVTTHFSICLIG